MMLSSAAVVMEIAEQIYNSLQKQRERHLITREFQKKTFGAESGSCWATATERCDPSCEKAEH